MKKIVGILLFITLGLMISPKSAAGQEAKVDAIVVFDLRAMNSNQAIVPRIYFTQEAKVIEWFIGILADLDSGKLEQLTGKGFQPIEVLECGRWISNEAQRIDVYAVYSDAVTSAEIGFAEEKRNSRMLEDMKTLFQLLPSLPAAEYQKGTESKLSFAHKWYYQEKKRGKLRISLDVAWSASVNRDGSPIKEFHKSVQCDLLTGPSEHFFLTADVPIFSVSGAKFVYQSDAGLGFAPKDTPAAVFVGWNFSFVDVIADKAIKPPYLKLMMQFSTKPLDAVGVGLGWNFPRVGFLDDLGFKTDAICLFGGLFLAKESDADGAAGKLRYQWRWGLSYDLSRLGDWVK